jgi:hypothetical protein
LEICQIRAKSLMVDACWGLCWVSCRHYSTEYHVSTSGWVTWQVRWIWSLFLAHCYIPFQRAGNRCPKFMAFLKSRSWYRFFGWPMHPRSALMRCALWFWLALESVRSFETQSTWVANNTTGFLPNFASRDSGKNMESCSRGLKIWYPKIGRGISMGWN